MYFRMATLLVALITYSTHLLAMDIILVKHARRTQSLPSAQYVIKEGDTLRDILTKVYGANEQDLPSLYTRFRQDNPGIANLDLIKAGSKISIPSNSMKDMTAVNRKKPAEALQVKPVPPNEYVIKQGQHLAMILREVYGIPDELIFDEYMALIKELNPEISNPDHVVPGQKVRIPAIKQVIAAAKRSQNGISEPSLATTTGVPPVAAAASRPPTVPPKVQEGSMIVRGEHNPAPGLSPKRSSLATAPAEQANTTGGMERRDEERGTGGSAKTASTASRTVRSTVLPALEDMGGKQKSQGTYFMPMSGGTSISVDTNEIPVIELDTGKKIIFDTNGMITPEIKGFIEKAFPSFKVISDSPASLEDLMDKVLSVSGYFSINKNASPLLVGEEEKVRFIGKWIVYKEFTRRNVFVINLLKDDESRTPPPIQKYAGRFGIDLIELGGRGPGEVQKNLASIKEMNHSYKTLFDQLKVSYETDKEIELVSGSVIRVAYKAPLLVGKVILNETVPDQTMMMMLSKHSYVLINTRTEPVDGVLKAIGLKLDGPPVKVIVAQGRTELEVPALRLGTHLILTKPVDQNIVTYIATTGMDVLIW